LDTVISHWTTTTVRCGEHSRFAEKGSEPSVAVIVIGNDLGGEVIRRIRDVDFALRGTGK